MQHNNDECALNEEFWQEQENELEIAPAADKETLGSLRKLCKRLKTSRDKLKANNFEKSTRIKALSGKIDDLQSSRESWKQKCHEKDEILVSLSTSLEEYVEKTKQNAHLLEEREKLLAAERQLRIDDIKKKISS